MFFFPPQSMLSSLAPSQKLESPLTLQTINKGDEMNPLMLVLRVALKCVSKHIFHFIWSQLNTAMDFSYVVS